MTDMTRPPDGGDEARLKEFHDAWKLLVSVRSTLADLLAEAAEGNTTELGEIVKKHGELQTALNRVFEMEKKWNDWHAKQSAGLRPGDIDFNAVRQELSCRLARLRACCRDG